MDDQPSALERAKRKQAEGFKRAVEQGMDETFVFFSYDLTAEEYRALWPSPAPDQREELYVIRGED